MGGGQGVHVEPLAAGGLAAVELLSVVRGRALEAMGTVAAGDACEWEDNQDPFNNLWI